MSVDLAVWEGPPPASDDEARAVFDELCARYLGRTSAPPTERIANYVHLLLDRYPDLAEAAGEEDEVPWGSGPMMPECHPKLPMMMSTTLPCRIVKAVPTGSGPGPARR